MTEWNEELGALVGDNLLRDDIAHLGKMMIDGNMVSLYYVLRDDDRVAEID